MAFICIYISFNRSCEYLLLEKINGSEINMIHYEENIPEDCSTLFERMGYEMIKREEY